MKLYTRDDNEGDYAEVRCIGGDVRIRDNGEGVVEVTIADPTSGAEALHFVVRPILGQAVMEKGEED